MYGMEIEIGKVYNVKIDDCCVAGSFTSKLASAEYYDDDEELVPASTLEYVTFLTFANGVKLEAKGGVTLTEVED